MEKQINIEKIGIEFVERKDTSLNHMIGKEMRFNCWKRLIKKYKLQRINHGSDRVWFYGNKEIDLSLRFEQGWDDDKMLLELTDIYHYHRYYEKSNEEINNDLIHQESFVSILRKHAENLVKITASNNKSTINTLSEDVVADCLIDAYIKLRDSGQLL